MKTASSPLPVDLGALAAWMDGQGLEQGPIADAALLTGGTQNILLKFRRGDRHFVLRRPPEHLRANSNETMRREARVLAALSGSAVPHPGLIAACADEDVLGAAFYLMEPVDGFNATAGLPPLHAGSAQVRREMGFAMVDGILALGRVDPVAAGLSDMGKVEGYLERQVPRWRAQLESYREFASWPGPDGIPGVETVADWLVAHRPARFTPGLIHGDYHIANVMFRHEGPQLAAIIDWELATVGDPLIDLGWLLATWPDAEHPSPAEVRIEPAHGLPSARELVAHYAAHSTRDVSAINWYAVLACYKLGIILEGTYARACAGKAARETGAQLHAQTIGLFERALAWISQA
jgi:aminoglycoside phosphotransferase (APT) family kinase protein